MLFSCEYCVLSGRGIVIDRWAKPSSRGVLPNVCVSLIVITCNSNFLHLQKLGIKRLD